MSNSNKVRVRFAPSPTGHLHLGNARTALYNWLFARSKGGKLILRLEDTDALRSSEESAVSVIEDLRWLGLDWDEGPERGGDFGPYRQTERYSIYHEYLQRLVSEGRAYPCYCSKEKLDAGREAARAAGATWVYPGTCRNLSSEERKVREATGEKPSYRLKTESKTVVFEDAVRGTVSVHTRQFGDWILARPDGSPTYNFAVVIDDSLMGITHVVRGEDHLSNTPKQILLYEALGFDAPVFAHISMILGPDGSKLSKRHGDVSLDALREKGFLPQAVINGLALMGWSAPDGREVLEPGEIVSDFSLARVHKAAAVFDETKFRYLNREHLKKLDGEALALVLQPWLVGAGLIPAGPSPEITSWLGEVGLLIRERMELLSEAAAACEPLFVFDPEGMDADTREAVRDPEAKRVIEAFLAKARETDLSVPGAYREAVLAIKDEEKVKGKALFHPIRVALTASESGPDLERLVPLLERGSRLDLPVPVLSPADRVRSVLALLS